MDLDNVVRFSSHPRPFVVTQLYCSNPDCSCNELLLNFTEISEAGHSLKNSLSFSACIDFETWEEKKSTRSRSVEVSRWIQEFIENCSASRRAEFKASFQEQRRVVRRKAEYTIDADEVLEGALISYADIVTGHRPLSAGGNAYTYDVHYQGREYLVEDRYCANPHCKCKAVHLEFFESVSGPDGQQRIYQRFLGKVTFAGQLIVENRMKYRLAEANAVLAAWWKQWGSDLSLLKDRYREAKEIGQRSLEAGASRPSTAEKAAEDASNQHPAANARVGRNAPCPCGSGKKYKKCCGQRATLPV